MKIKFPLAVIVLMMTGLLSSCIMKDDYADCPPKKGLKIVSSINFEGSSSFLPKGSSIGVTLLKSGTNECFGGNSDRHYIVSDTQTGESLPKEDENTIYLPEDNSLVDAMAYYPYTIPFDKKYQAKLSVLDQSKPDSLDLITSDRVCNITGDVEQIDLNFCRRLTKLTFDITLIEIDADGNETVINHKLPGTILDITGMPVSGNYSLPDNLLTVSDDIHDISTLINKEGTKSGAIVFPREPGEGVTFIATLPDGSKHTFVMDPKQALKAGTENKFDIVIKVKKETPEVPSYKITYELQGTLTPQNIAVSQGSENASWGLNQTIIVKQNSDFSFLYNSDLSVTARLSDGTLLDMKNNTSYLFTTIHKDIHIILSSADSPDNPEPPVPPVPGSYKVSYELQGDLTAYNISLKQNGNTWTAGDVITVEEGGNFSFLYNSALDVIVRLSDGTGLNMSNNRSYSFTDIHKDIHIILSSKEIPVPPVPPVYYKVTYELKDGLTADNVVITRGGADNLFWPTDVIVTAQEGSYFIFTYKNNGGTVESVVINDKIITDTENEVPYKITNIRRDQHIILGGIENHVVKLLVNLPDREPSGTSTLVYEKGSYKFKVPVLTSGKKVIVKINEVVTEVIPDKDGYYTIENIDSDKTILITVEKTNPIPDAVITADVHKWTFRDSIDGGIILPE